MARNKKNQPAYWTEHLGYLQKSILAQIKRTRKSSHHPSIAGISIEAILRRTLREYFPHRFSIGAGQAAAPDGKISPQMDILIYDNTMFPLLARNEDGSVVVCCESVFGGIEVKTKWNHDVLEAHFGKFTEIEQETT